MKHHCKSKKELLKEIEWWVKNLKGELEIKIRKDKELKNTYEVYLFDNEEALKDDILC